MVREKLIALIQQKYPTALPHTRISLNAETDTRPQAQPDSPRH